MDNDAVDPSRAGTTALPERFEALPDNVPRQEQLHVIRATRYDTYLWGRDHRARMRPGHLRLPAGGSGRMTGGPDPSTPLILVHVNGVLKPGPASRSYGSLGSIPIKVRTSAEAE